MKDILSEYGPESPSDKDPGRVEGGCMYPSEIPYSPPKGPIGIGHKGVGLGGSNHGNAPGQGKH